jgi:hypothetical protein
MRNSTNRHAHGLDLEVVDARGERGDSIGAGRARRLYAA